MVDDDVTNGRATTASIDRRVERLEESQGIMQSAINALSTDVQLLKSDLSHIRDLMGSRFSTVEATLSTLAAKLDQLLTLGQSWAGDLTQTPAGRMTMEAMTRLEGSVALISTRADAHDADIREAKGMAKGIKLILGGSLIALLGSAFAIAVAIMQLLGVK